MFENVIGYSDITDLIAGEIRSETFPPAVLLTGEELSGKGTIALESARALTCREDGDWRCQCTNCRAQRALAYPELVLLGTRDFETEIKLSATTLLNDPRPARVFLFLRAVRKLLYRYDERFIPEKRFSKAASTIEHLREDLARLEPPAVLPQEAEVRERVINAIVERAEKLVELLPREGVSVDVVRAITAWSRTSASLGKKIVILEEVHLLQEAARNAMLKLLEEPPADTNFILTSSRPSAIIPTILSRLRRYDLPHRSAADDQTVQTRIFGSNAPAPTLRSFFRIAAVPQDYDVETLINRAERLVRGDSAVEEAVITDFRSLASRIGPRPAFEFLLAALYEQFDPGESSPVDRERTAAVSQLLQRSRDRVVLRNMNPQRVFEGFVYAVGEIS